MGSSSDRNAIEMKHDIKRVEIGGMRKTANV